jgi:hypothetical protein
MTHALSSGVYAKYVPKKVMPAVLVQVRVCLRAVCKAALLNDTRGRFAHARSVLWTVAGQLAEECRASPDGGHV